MKKPIVPILLMFAGFACTDTDELLENLFTESNPL